MRTKLRKADAKAIFQFTVILIIIYALCGSAAAISGSGTQQNPYQIGSEQDLIDLAGIIDTTSPGTYLYVVQTANIELQTPGNIIPINDPSPATSSNGQNSNFKLLGTSVTPFYGKYDGANYTITGLHYQEWRSPGAGKIYQNNIGLFGETDNSTIENVRLKDAKMWGNQNVGTLIGKSNNTTIKNCIIENTTVNVSMYGGGLAGLFEDGLIENSSVSGKITENVQNSEFGGIAGRVNNAGIIRNCYFAGTIKTASVSSIGGIAGFVGNGTILNCYSVCDLEGGTIIGGIVGMIKKGTIEECYSIGTITAVMITGGIVGAIDNTASAGEVTIENNIALNEQINYMMYGNRVIGRGNTSNPLGTNFGWGGMINSSSATFTEGGNNGTNVTSKKIWSTFPNNEWTPIFDTNIWKLNTYDDYRLPVFKWQTEELQEDASYLRASWDLPQISIPDVVQSDDSNITLSFEITWNDEISTQANWDVELFYSESANISASNAITATFDGTKYTATIQNLDPTKEYHAWGTTTHQSDFTFINGPAYTFMLGGTSGGIGNGGNGTGNATVVDPDEEKTKPGEPNPEEPSPRSDEPEPDKQKPNMWKIYLFYIIAILCFIGKEYLENKMSKQN